MDSKCELCDHKSQTTFHILNGRPVSLNQGRYTWRHDSVLLRIAMVIHEHSKLTLLDLELQLLRLYQGCTYKERI